MNAANHELNIIRPADPLQRKQLSDHARRHELDLLKIQQHLRRRNVRRHLQQLLTDLPNHALVVQGGLTSGRWALVHAGASGVGTAGIQIAKAIGARVAVTCSAGKVDACRDLGADVVLERSPADWLGALSDAVPGGVDVVLDGAAEAYELLPELQAAGCWVLPHPAMARTGGELKNGTMTLPKLLADAGVPFAHGRYATIAFSSKPST